MTQKFSLSRRGLVYLTIGACFITLFAALQLKAAAQDNLTPGMLFGPLQVADGQHLELCGSYLGTGSLKATIHFRNLTTNEVTAGQDVTFPSGGGQCAVYRGAGLVVGLARGDGAASDWVSPTNALISTMSLIDENPPVSRGGATLRTETVRASVLGVAKIWVRGL